MEAGGDNLKIGVDLDGTISEYPVFFKLFTRAMAEAGCRIYIITDRPIGTEAYVERELEEYGITYHTIKITSNKAKYIIEEGISVLYDDRDEYFLDLPEEVAVFKIREKYNFDFINKRWLD
ncbi:MAG: hypothetical protein ACYS0I_04065 [Planctomycetota bacterium]|jgi:2-hydroxy-3-keto-5-methylthiopentenyl-1-phosphate phosphatase